MTNSPHPESSRKSKCGSAAPSPCVVPFHYRSIWFRYITEPSTEPAAATWATLVHSREHRIRFKHTTTQTRQLIFNTATTTHLLLICPKPSWTLALAGSRFLCTVFEPLRRLAAGFWLEKKKKRRGNQRLWFFSKLQVVKQRIYLFCYLQESVRRTFARFWMFV